MGYARLHHWYWHDPKFHKLPAATERLWTRALAYADYHLTDGLISLSALKDLSGTRAQADKLTAVGLWHERPDGWQINRYLDYAASRAEVERKREANRRRQQRHRERTQDTAQTALNVEQEMSQNYTGNVEESEQKSQRNEREMGQSHAVDNYVNAGKRNNGDSDNALLTRPTQQQHNSTQLNTGLRGVSNVTVGSPHPRDGGAAAPGMDKMNLCSRHAHIPPGEHVPPCNACRDARLANERKRLELDREASQAARTRRECPWCDESGWLRDDETGETIIPTVRCDHQPLRQVAGL